MVCCVGCATGGTPSAANNDAAAADAPVGQHDAPVTPRDARPDAFVSVDASVDATVPPDASIPPDAPPGSIFCSHDSDCVPGDCCFTLGSPPGFCVAGTTVLNVCIPSGN